MKKFVLYVGLFLVLTTNYAQQVIDRDGVISNPESIPMIFLGETAPWRDFVEDDKAVYPIVKPPKYGYHDKDDWHVNPKVNPNALPQGEDPLLQKSYSTNTVRSTQMGNWEGMQTSTMPGDPCIDVGPNHIVQMLNGNSGAVVKIWDKSGNVLLGQTLFKSLAGTPTGLGDPIVLYDQRADRWMLTEFSASNNDMYIAISTTPDPTGSYYTFSVTGTNFPDYPKYSIWDDTYIITTNENSSAIYAMNRTTMLSGGATSVQRFTMPNYGTIGFQTAAPVSLMGTTVSGGPCLLMRIRDDGWSNVSSDALEMWELNINWASPGSATLAQVQTLPVSPYESELCGYTSFSCIPQPGGNDLDPLREIIMNRVMYRNFGTHESIVCAHVTDVNGADLAGIRWYELRRTGGSWSIYQEGTYSPDSENRWMPTIGISASGNIGLAYNVSSTSTHPEIRYTGRKECDPLGIMTETEVILVDGTAVNNSNRWGDYNAMGVDPVDGETFWFTAQYSPNTQARTRIGAFKIDNCAPTVQFSNSTYTTDEANANIANGCLDYVVVQVPIQIGSDPSQPAGILVNVTGGTAIQGVDYDISNTSFNLDNTTLSGTVEIWVYNDDIVEGNETITLDYTLNANGGNASTGSVNQTVTITINDDDLAPANMVSTTTILTQDFETGLAPFTTVNASGNTPWQVGNNAAAATTAYAIPTANTSQFAWINDDACNCDQNNVDLLFPSIDLTNYTSASLTFDSYFENNTYQGVNESAVVKVSIGGGAFTTITSVVASQIDVSWSSQTIDLTPYVGNANVQFSINYSDGTGWLYGCAIDNVVITGSGPIDIQTIVNSGAGDQAYLGPNQTVHFYDPATSDVMMTLKNTSSFDYGCVTVEVDRDGSSPTAMQFASTSIPDYLHSKTYKVTPTNNNPTGTYDVTVYYKEAEVAAWEAFTGNTRNSLEIIKVAGNNRINDVTPANYSTYTIDNIVATMGTFNSDLTFKASFTNGFSGFGLGIYNITTTTVSHTSTTTNITCNGANNGTITVTASGGTSPYQYSIDNGVTWQTSNSFVGLTTGSYSVLAKDAGGNQSTASSVSVTEPSVLSYSTSSSNLICNGSNNGSISLTASGGTSPFQYSINGGTNFQTSGSFSSLSAGTYSIVVEDANGCQATGSVTVTEPTAVTHVSTVTNLTCNGSSNGSISIAVSGGIGVIQYSNNNGGSFQVSNSFTSLSAGTYNIVVKDANGCQSTETVVVTQPSVINYSNNSTNLSCNGSNDGSILLTGTGGTGTLQYSIDGGTSFQSSGGFNSLSAGTYSIVIKDANNCTKTGTITLTEPNGVNYTVSSNNPSCNGNNDGSISFSSSGGPNPVTYSINGGTNFQGNSNFNGLSAGTYNLVVKDGNGCLKTQTLTLTDPSSVFFTASTTPENCGAADGTITINGAGGTGVLQYSINSGSSFQASNSFSGLSAGVVNIVIQDANGCQAIGTQTIGNVGGANITNTTKTNPTCNGDVDGSITVAASGGTGSLQYSIDGGTTFQSGNSFSAIGAGSYNVVVEDANGCQTTATVTITDPVAISYSAVTASESCGQSNGSISITASGGTGTLQYSINGGATFQTSAIFNSLTSGTYNIVVEDANNCQITGTETVGTDSGPVVNSVVKTNPLCNGNANGSIFIAASGGSGTLQYSDNNGSTFQTSATFTGLVAGTYNLVVQDAGGCQTTTTATLVAPTVLTSSSSTTNVTCNGDSDGSIILTGSGGTSPYQYSINGGVNFQTSGTFSGQGTGTYNYIVKDANGCQVSGSSSISGPSAVVLSSTSSNPVCNGNANGTISLSATGGVGFYQFSVNGGTSFQSSGAFTGLTGGTYNLVAQDANGCQSTGTVTISEPSAITYGSSTNAVSCNGGSNGSITITGTGGSGSLQYSIDGGTSFQSSGTFSGLTAGTYSIVIKDVNNCLKTGSITITEPSVLSFTSSLTDPTCNGGNDGTISITAIGGMGTYQYSINSGTTFQSSASFTGLSAGIYSVMVKDINGCQVSGSITLSDPAGVTYSVASMTENCGLSDGSITITASGGASPLNYSIDNGSNYQTANVFNGLSAGTYNFIIQDANLCMTNGSTSVGSSSGVSIASTTFTRPSCNGGTDGEIVITATGGVAPLTYSVDGGITYQTSGTFTSVGGGTYAIVVRDATGCLVTTSLAVTEPSLLSYTSVNSDENCGLADGQITVNANGGTSPYVYSINGGTSQTSGIFNGLVSGTYSVEVIDAKGCLSTGTETISGSGGATIGTITSNNPLCFGDNNGSLNISATGGTIPISYSINNGTSFQSSAQFNSLSAGTYSIVVKDGAGCQNTASVTLIDPASMTISSAASNENCGAQDGSIAITISGGTSAFMYSINGGGTFQSSGTYSGLSAGVYSILVQDANGCQATGIETINGSGGASINSVSYTPVSCYGGSDGTLTVAASGGIAPLQYSINGGATLQTSNTFTGLTAGSYVVMVEDANGCQELVSQTVDSPTQIIISISETDASCGNNDGSALASVSGGNGIYSYQWDDALSQTTQNAINLSGGFYTVTVTDGVGCTETGIALVNNIGEPNMSISATSTSCYGEADGTATATVTGGIAPITYEWNDANSQSTATASNLQAGSYIVLVTDSNNCIAIETVIVSEPDSLVLNEIITHTTCSYNNGLAMVNVSGGTPSYSYQWNDANQQSFSSAIGLAAGDYTVLVTDANDCQSSLDISILNSDSLIVTVDVINESCPEQYDGSISTNVESGTSPYFYNWNTGDTAKVMENLTAGNYILTVKDANNCESIILIPIEVLGENCIEIPTAISPNNDGANDAWVINGLDDYPDANVEIYNRWGSLIFSTNEYHNDWDGTYNGKIIPAGVYYFVITISEDEVYTGSLTVLR